jgi:hypothetical protein
MGLNDDSIKYVWPDWDRKRAEGKSLIDLLSKYM